MALGYFPSPRTQVMTRKKLYGILLLFSNTEVLPEEVQNREKDIGITEK